MFLFQKAIFGLYGSLSSDLEIKDVFYLATQRSRGLSPVGPEICERQKDQSLNTTPLTMPLSASFPFGCLLFNLPFFRQGVDSAWICLWLCQQRWKLHCNPSRVLSVGKKFGINEQSSSNEDEARVATLFSVMFQKAGWERREEVTVIERS